MRLFRIVLTLPYAVLLTACSAVYSAPVSPQTYVPPPDPAQRLERSRYLAENAFRLSDTNQDGRLSEAEWFAQEWLIYGEYDHNRDGRLSPEEFHDMRCGGYGADTPSRPPRRRWCLSSATREFRRLAGSRGAIVPESLAGQARRGFRFNDLDRGGYVTRDEQLRAIQRQTGRRR
jgi:hypothetical protein